MAPALPPRGCRVALAPPHWRGAAGPHLIHLTGARPHRRHGCHSPAWDLRRQPRSLLGYVLTSGTDYRWIWWFFLLSLFLDFDWLTSDVCKVCLLISWNVPVHTGLEISTPAVKWHSARYHQRKAWWDCWCSLLLNSLAAQLLTCLPECVGMIQVLQHFPTLTLWSWSCRFCAALYRSMWSA
jgi:hypothetical protein